MRYEEIRFKSLYAVVRYPNSYAHGKRYPVIILLHGAGGRGDDLRVTRQNPFSPSPTKWKTLNSSQ